jgi:hypothetical protein
MIALVTLLTSAAAATWACGSGGGSDGPATQDSGADAPAPPAPPPVDAGNDAPPSGPTAGTCGPTVRSTALVRDGIPANLVVEQAVGALAAGADGTLYAAGYTYDNGDGGVGAGPAILLESRDAMGGLTWRKIAGSTGGGFLYVPFARAHGVVVDDTGVIVAGGFAGTLGLGGAPLISAFKGPTAPCLSGTDDCNPDAFVARFDRTSGAHVWSVRFGNVDNDSIGAIARAGDGSLFVGGDFQGTVDFGVTKLTSAGKSDAFVAHLDSNGVALGAFSIGGAGDESIAAIAVDASGDVIVGGTYGSAITIGTKTLTPKGNYDGFAARFSAAGVPVWSRAVAAAKDARITGVASDGAGGAFVAGSADGANDFGTAVRIDDIAVAHLDATGAIAWSKVFGGDGNDVAYAIARTADGNILFTGTTDSPYGIDFGGGKLGATMGDDGQVYFAGPFFVELDATGKHVCSRHYNSMQEKPHPDASLPFVGGYGRAIVATSAKGFAAAGSFGGRLDVGAGEMSTHGGGELPWLGEFTR